MGGRGSGRRTGSSSSKVEDYLGIDLAWLRRRGCLKPDESWRAIDELVPFMETQNGFGGYRRWFRCLGCSRRCRIIYGGSHFRCRRCHALKYQSQYERPFTRATNRAQKLRDRLGKTDAIDDPFPPRPKGMHWRTYRRLEALDNKLQEKWSAALIQCLRLFD
jgi:hypothetical protein